MTATTVEWDPFAHSSLDDPFSAAGPARRTETYTTRGFESLPLTFR